MKVYELMAFLEGVPGGAEVEFRTIMDVPELQTFPVVEETEGAYYAVGVKVKDAELIDDKVVALYK